MSLFPLWFAIIKFGQLSERSLDTPVTVQFLHAIACTFAYTRAVPPPRNRLRDIRYDFIDWSKQDYTKKGDACKLSVLDSYRIYFQNMYIVLRSGKPSFLLTLINKLYHRFKSTIMTTTNTHELEFLAWLLKEFNILSGGSLASTVSNVHEHIFESRLYISQVRIS